MKIFLDSCVILSRIPRELMLKSAKEGLLKICYSQSIEDECKHVAMRKGMEADIAAAFIELQLYAQKFADPIDSAEIWLPDENDRHVVLGAMAAEADIIATENLRDFPNAALNPIGLQAQTPDQILQPFVMKNQLIVEEYNRNALKRAKLYRVARQCTQKD